MLIASKGWDARPLARLGKPVHLTLSEQKYLGLAIPLSSGFRCKDTYKIACGVNLRQKSLGK
jgi:hypothetical protein